MHVFVNHQIQFYSNNTIVFALQLCTYAYHVYVDNVTIDDRLRDVTVPRIFDRFVLGCTDTLLNLNLTTTKDTS